MPQQTHARDGGHAQAATRPAARHQQRDQRIGQLQTPPPLLQVEARAPQHRHGGAPIGTIAARAQHQTHAAMGNELPVRRGRRQISHQSSHYGPSELPRASPTNEGAARSTGQARDTLADAKRQMVKSLMMHNGPTKVVR